MAEFPEIKTPRAHNAIYVFRVALGWIRSRVGPAPKRYPVDSQWDAQLAERMIRDVTREATKAIGDQFRLLVQRVRDYAIFLLDPDGNIASWNEGLQRIKGYTADDIIGKHLSVFYTPEDNKEGVPARLLYVARTVGQVESEGWRLRKDGSRFWADVVITALRDDDGTLLGFGKVTRDLTERKAAENALSELSGRLIGVQEEERLRIGRELHDTTSPLLTSLTGKLYSARQRARSYPDILALVDESLALTEATATMVRTVSSLLHPPLLDQSGLLVALRWYLDVFASRSGSRVDAALPDTIDRMRPDQEVILFRVTQEWLRAAQQVGASSVRLRFSVEGKEAHLYIQTKVNQWPRRLDDLKSGRGEIGAMFAGMRERIRQMGGALNMTSAPEGLAVQVRLPVSRVS